MLDRVKFFHVLILCTLLFFGIGCSSGGGGGSNGGGVTVGSVQIASSFQSLEADGLSEAQITVTVNDADGEPIANGTEVTFTTTSGTFEGNGVKETKTTSNGQATINLVSSNLPGTATVKATAGGISAQMEVTFTQVLSFMSLSVSQTAVKSDNSDFAEVVATILDANRVPVEGVTVGFRTSVEGGTTGGGQLSSATAETDENGEAKVQFSSGTIEKKNQTVTIEASVPSAPDLGVKQVPVQITGTTVKVETDKTNLEIDPANPQNAVTQLTITVNDANETLVNDAPVTFEMSEPGIVTITPSNGSTGIDGKLTVDITGINSGKVTITAKSLGAQADQTYTVGAVGEVFKVLSPTEDPYPLKTNQNLVIEVNAPEPEGGSHPGVRFVTTLGSFVEGGTNAQVLVRPVVNGKAAATLRSSIAGIATVEVFHAGDVTIRDSLSVMISAMTADASKIALQANAQVVAPSTEETKNTVTLTAIVRTANDQPVGSAPVAFSIVDPIGGGEKIEPAYVITDSAGYAKTTFTSGALSSDANGVTIKARIVRGSGYSEISDTVSIVIGGTAGSIAIGRGTTITSIENDTAYSIPMSVVVSDTNGNPVPSASVTLKIYPIAYYIGYWVGTDECFQVITGGPYDNEDLPGRNGWLDPGEDLNQDGQLTPPSSAAGEVVAQVNTDENGIANFTLEYSKSSAGWIRNEFSASTRVLGTETKSTIVFTLPWLAGEECNLPSSPYDPPAGEGIGQVKLTSLETTGKFANGTDTYKLTAQVLDSSGQPIEGQEVTFFVQGNDGLVTFNPVSGSTGADGTITADISDINATDDSMTVTASAGETQSAPLPLVFNGNEGTTQVGVIKIAAPQKTGVVADGEESYTVTAQVLDSSGMPIIGQPITFVASGNSGLVTFKPSPLGVSDATGTVTVSVADINPNNDIITVRASSGGRSDSLTLEFTGTETIPEVVDTVVLAIQNANDGGDGTVDADGNDSYTLLAVVFDASGNPIDNINVIFDVEYTTLATVFLNPAYGSTRTDGTIITTVTEISQYDDTVTVRAEAGGVTSNDVSMNFVGDPISTSSTSAAKTINITESDFANNSIDAFRSVASVSDISGGVITVNTNETAEISASVVDGSGAAVSGAPVVFTLDNPVLGYINSTAKTNSDGEATATFRARDSAGKVVVTAISGSASSQKTVIVEEPSVPSNLNLIVNSSAVRVRGNIEVIAEVTDENGDPVSAGTKVIFKVADPLSGSITSFATTNASGFASAVFTALNQPGKAMINAISGGVTDSVSIEIEAAMSPSIEFVSAVPEMIGVKGSGDVEASNVCFRVSDANGTPLEGAKVLMKIAGPNGGEYINSSNGKSDNADVFTNIDGIAQIKLHTGLLGGIVTVSANFNAGGISKTVMSSPISIGGGLLSDGNFSVSATVYNLPGFQYEDRTTDITAYLADRFGNYNVLEGNTLSFVAEAGLLVDDSNTCVNRHGVAGVTARTRQPVDPEVSAPENVNPEIWEEKLQEYILSKYGVNFNGHPRDGLVSILVYGHGEESFTDLDGDGLFSGSPEFNPAAEDTFSDPFVDYNDDGTWTGSLNLKNDPEEIYIDGDNPPNQAWDGKNRVWDNDKFIFKNLKLIVSGSPVILFDQPSFEVGDGGFATIKIIVSDENLNPLTQSSIVNIEASGGKLLGRTQNKYPDSNTIGPDMNGHLSLIEYVVVISDDNPGDNNPSEEVALTVTVEWEGITYRSEIKGELN